MASPETPKKKGKEKVFICHYAEEISRKKRKGRKKTEMWGKSKCYKGDKKMMKIKKENNWKIKRIKKMLIPVLFAIIEY